MNWVDRMVAHISPVTGVRRVVARKALEILDSGYSEGGASHQKKSMRGWRANSASPREDIDHNLNTLRQRARDLAMNAPLGTAAIKTARTNVVGSGLRLKARIDADFLGLTEEQADAWERKAEREFALWAESVHCDALRINDFFSIQQLGFMASLASGDAFVLLKWTPPTPWMPYSLRLHLIEADRVSTPNQTVVGVVEGRNKDNGNPIISGVEVDKSTGAIVAYWVANRHPQSVAILPNHGVLSWERIEAFGAQTGRPNVIHLFEGERPEQLRGAPFLSPVIEALKQVSRYSEAELMAAVISSMFTVFVKTEGPTSDMPLGEMIPDEQKVADDDPAAYEMGQGAINVLGPGEEIQLANPGRPNANFEQFVNALTRYIGAALEIPQELLQKSFQASYSASRAALLEAWKMFRMRRSWLTKDLCQPVYVDFLSEAVALGRIQAPGFFTDPVIQRAWCGAEWSGPAPGQVDPLKEVKAARERIALCVSTRERESIELTGSDFDRNVQQLAREEKLMKASGLEPSAAAPADPAKEVNKEDDE